MALTWDKATFDELYNLSGELWGHYPGGSQKEVRLGYNHHVIGGPSATDRANRLKNNLSIPSGANVVHVGPGFGWTLEGYARIGINAAGFDTSDYIDQNKATSEEPDLRARIEVARGAGSPDTYMMLGPTSRVSDHLENYRLLDGNGKPIKEAAGQETNAEGYQIDMAALPSNWPTGRNSWLMPDVQTTTPAPQPNVGTGWIDSPHPDGSGKRVWMAPILDVYLRERSGLSPRTEAEVIQEDGVSNRSQVAIGRTLGNSFDFIISEHVITALTNDEALTLAKTMQDLNGRFGGQMIHLVTLPPRDPASADSRLNLKTLADWRALFDANGFIAHKVAAHWGRLVV